MNAILQLGFGYDLHGGYIDQRLLTVQAIMSANATLPVDNVTCDIADMTGGNNETTLFDSLMAVKPEGLTLNAWAVRAGVNRTIFNDIKKRGNVRHDSLVKLLSAAGVTLADFEAGHSRVRSEVRGTGLSPNEAREAWAMSSGTPVPLLGSAFGGEWNGLEDVEMIELRLAEVLDYLARPPALAEDPEAYAVEIVGESMYPRYKPGERAFVSPRAQVRVGDDVIVQLRADGDPSESDFAGKIIEILIKELVKRSSSYIELRQFNPDKTFRVPTDRVHRIHRVRGRL